MGTNLLNIGRTGLLAAQAGLSTTGHNISNANVDGFSRQVAIQGTLPGQSVGYGFVGSGTEVVQIKRFYDNFTASQVRSAQSSTSSLDTYYSQISQIDNMLADSTSGLSPALQDFFKGVQDLAANPASTASRQALLSGADSLASRFQSISARLTEIGSGVNSQIDSSVDVINSYGTQIAQLNESIAGLTNGPSNQPNDLLDQRDQLINELNKYVRATVVPGDNNTLTVSIGSGQPLVVGNRAFQLAATPSLTDPGRLEVGYVTGSKTTVLPESALNGGSLGGLLEFRANGLDRVKNSVGLVATALASSFNAQHKLGQDQNGALGTDFFSINPPLVKPDYRNNPTSDTAITATVSDPSKMTASDYEVKYDGAAFVVTRQSDGQKTVINPYPQTVPQTIDGVDYTITATSAAQGDNYLVQPTVGGASSFKVLLTDRAKIAAAAPISTAAPTANTGNGKISAGSVDAAYLTPGNALTAPLTLTYDKASASFSFSPATQDVTVTSNGVATVYPAGTPVPYTDGGNINLGGVNFAVSGTPGDQDTFTVGPNTSGVGDSRNAALLAKLQTTNILDGGKATFQGAYAETVSYVGNKTREAQVNGLASAALLAETEKAQQSVSGVNLDEEAANLLRYQQAYQASGKVMQIAGTLFDVLLSLGR